MSVYGIQGRTLEVKVVGCTKLKDTEWFTKQDPFVDLEYGDTMFRTKTCRGGYKTPYFHEEFKFTLIEGLRELNVRVWNKRTLTKDDFIGIGKVKLEKVLSEGNDDSSWALRTQGGSFAGEIQLHMHYSRSKIQKTDTVSHAPSCAPPPPPNYYQPPPPPKYYPPPTPPHPVYSPAPAYCPPQPYYVYPSPLHPSSSGYPQQAYFPPPGYPQQAYPPPPPGYPQQAYAPPSGGLYPQIY